MQWKHLLTCACWNSWIVNCTFQIVSQLSTIKLQQLVLIMDIGNECIKHYKLNIVTYQTINAKTHK